jgi:hypothetical protein
MGPLHSWRALNCPAVDLQAFEAVCKKLIERMRAPALNCVELSMNELCDITSKVAEKVYTMYSKSMAVGSIPSGSIHVLAHRGRMR